MKIEDRYIDGSYASRNPDWDRRDAAWKADLVRSIVTDHAIPHRTICEVGCGAGDTLRLLTDSWPGSAAKGYDVAPDLRGFWPSQQSGPSAVPNPSFELGDFHSLNAQKYDLLLMLDVFEHVRDPFSFLEDSAKHADHFVFHIPLDLSAMSVLREGPLLDVRHSVGHLHYYTKSLALETLTDCGYEVLEWRYTSAYLNAPAKSWRTRIARLPRLLLFSINRDFGVRLLGGETLLVLARPRRREPA